jgi:hypothetical protein
VYDPNVEVPKNTNQFEKEEVGLIMKVFKLRTLLIIPSNGKPTDFKTW